MRIHLCLSGDSVWFKSWKEEAEASLMRFLGDNKLPRHNPFLSMPRWADTQASVSAALATAGNVEVCLSA